MVRPAMRSPVILRRLLPMLLVLAACDGASGSLPGADLGPEADVAGDPGRDVKDPRDVRDTATWDAQPDGPAPDGEDADGLPDAAPDAVDDVMADAVDDGADDALPDAVTDGAADALDDALPDADGADAAGEDVDPADVPARDPGTAVDLPPSDVAPDVAPDLPSDVPEPRPDTPEPSPDTAEPPPDIPDVPDVADVPPEASDPGGDTVDPRCDRTERWAYETGYDVPQNTPICLTYVPDANYDATWCEFWPEAFAIGHYGHYGIPFDWLEGLLRVEPAHIDGTVLDAGLWTLYEDPSTFAQDTRVSFGRSIDTNLWRVGFTYLYSGMMGEGSYHWSIRAFAFFVDVQRPSGSIDRLWQSDSGANWVLPDAFTLPSVREAIPYGYRDWSDGASALFDPRRACTF